MKLPEIIALRHANQHWSARDADEIERERAESMFSGVMEWDRFSERLPAD
jgi:hypothetical protein